MKSKLLTVRVGEQDVKAISHQLRWNRANPEKCRAHDIVRRALRKGTLKRGKCWCGSLRVEAHHPDYNQPLLVEWLCRLHHKQLHALARRMAA